MKGRVLSVSVFSCFLAVVLSYADGPPTAKRPVKPMQPASTPAPAPPATLEQKPPTPPQISFQGGQLTITAQNSTLGDILKGVRAQTGAEVDVPGNATERVVGHFGPGPARDVLASLLYGSRFNYVLLGSPNDPSVLGRVILMAKSGAEPEPASQENSAQPLAQNQPLRPGAAGVPGTAAAADTDDEDDSDDSDDSADDQTASDDDQQQQGAAAADGTQNGQVVKTPEQLMQELQQRQQQMQQQMQQGVNNGDAANNGDQAVPNPPVGIAPRPLPGQEPH